jgi:hypothetical protein
MPEDGRIAGQQAVDLMPGQVRRHCSTLTPSKRDLTCARPLVKAQVHHLSRDRQSRLDELAHFAMRCVDAILRIAKRSLRPPTRKGLCVNPLLTVDHHAKAPSSLSVPA